MENRKITCKQCGKRMRRAHAFARRYWTQNLTGLKTVYRCECGARRAVVLFDEEEVIDFVQMVEQARREAEDGYWEERRKRSQWAEALRRRSVRQARREVERLLIQNDMV